MKETWTRFMQDESGQGLVEYILIIAVVAIGLLAALYLFRDKVGDTFENVANTLEQQPTDQWAQGGGS
jgi:pilus assembly protein Flp/PilA